MTTRTTALALLLTGCFGPGPATSPSCTDCADPTDPAPLPDRDESCLQGVPASQVQVDLTTIDETAGSYHEMVACGGLAFQMNQSLIQILVTSLLDAQGVEIPGGFVYEGEGRYHTQGGGTDMTVSYLYGDDLEVGLEDEPVLHNVFDFENYLRGTSVTLDLDGQGLDVSWTQTGPLVELLGRGTEPPNPVHFGLDALELPYRIGRLKAVTEIEVESTTENATVVYTLASDPKRIRPMLDGGELEFSTLSSQTINAHGGQLVSTTWGVGYNNVAGALNGAIDFELHGSVDLVGTYDFADSSYPLVYWTCR